jgi:hypothetical protein
MAASGSDTVSVVERTRPITISGGIVAVYFLGTLHSFLAKKRSCWRRRNAFY